jgi:hypothetical protein
MTQASGSISNPVALNYEDTLVPTIKLRNANWVLVAQIPGLLRVKSKQAIKPTTDALLGH